MDGAERESWLHTVSSQDVGAVPEGGSTQNLSLDGQGRVEDHWIQSELGGTSYLDTEPWRAEPLLAYLARMVFWSDAAPAAADLAVLSLIGPALAEPELRDALGLTAAGQDALPAEMTAVGPPRGGFPRRMPRGRGGPRGALGGPGRRPAPPLVRWATAVGPPSAPGRWRAC